MTLPGWDLPGAIYIDSIDRQGTIRTGPTKFGPHFQPGDAGDDVADVPYGNQRYAYTATCLLASVRRLCSGSDSPLCSMYEEELQGLRSQFPLVRWDDPSTGRCARQRRPLWFCCGAPLVSVHACWRLLRLR